MNLHDTYDNDQLENANPSIFEAQKKPSTKAIENLKEWRDSEADSSLEKEWCDAVLKAAKDAKEAEWSEVKQ